MQLVEGGVLDDVDTLVRLSAEVALFITELAFEAGPIAHAARAGILMGSLVAGVAGYLVLQATLPAPGAEGDA